MYFSDGTEALSSCMLVHYIRKAIVSVMLCCYRFSNTYVYSFVCTSDSNIHAGPQIYEL